MDYINPYKTWYLPCITDGYRYCLVSLVYKNPLLQPEKSRGFLHRPPWCRIAERPQELRTLQKRGLQDDFMAYSWLGFSNNHGGKKPGIESAKCYDYGTRVSLNHDCGRMVTRCQATNSIKFPAHPPRSFLDRPPEVSGTWRQIKNWPSHNWEFNLRKKLEQPLNWDKIRRVFRNQFGPRERVKTAKNGFWTIWVKIEDSQHIHTSLEKKNNL